MSIFKKTLIFMLKCLKWFLIIIFLIMTGLIASNFFRYTSEDIIEMMEKQMPLIREPQKIKQVLEKYDFKCNSQDEVEICTDINSFERKCIIKEQKNTYFCERSSTSKFFLASCMHKTSFVVDDHQIIHLNIDARICAGL